MTATKLGLSSVLLASGCFAPHDPIVVTGEQSDSGGSDDSTTSVVSTLGSASGTADGSGDATSSSSTGQPSTDGVSTEPTTGAGCAVAAECGELELCIDGQCRSCDSASDPDAACADASADTPYCDAQLGCVACIAAVCDGDTPACDPMVGCVACTEHTQCPDSACHLMGPDAGSCFDVADVVEVSSVSEFEDAMASIGPGAQRVLRVTDSLALGSYIVDGEVAIIGSPGVAITGGYTNLFIVNDLLYLASLHVSDGAFRMLTTAAGVWLDDVDVFGYGNVLNLQSGAEAHVRRSRLTTNGAANPAIINDGDLFVENSSIGPGADQGISSSGAVDLRYVTLAGNATALNCETGASGLIRNSILASTTSNSVLGCGALSWIDDAVDSPGLGDLIEMYDAAWFVDASERDFHLSAAGEAAISSVADWDEGDPLVDIDGDPRPLDGPGWPGIDEP